MQQKYWINAIDKPGLLVALMRLLADEAQISFEGDLSECDFSDIEEINYDIGEINCYNNTDQTNLKIFHLTQKSIKPILKQILPKGRVVHKILQIKIQKNNEIQFLSGDNFHNECISVGPLVPVDFLEELKAKGTIRSFVTDAEAKEKYL